MGPNIVVVLDYRGRDDTIRCVDSLVSGTPTAVILVVDNGSDDGVLEEVAARWPQVQMIQAGDNLGFSGGMNRGLAWALEQAQAR